MQLVPTLVYLALWISSVYAFFPYKPYWLQELEAEAEGVASAASHNGIAFEIKQRTGRPVASHSQQAAREAARLAGKYIHEALVRRKNTYKVISAATPTTSNAAGINQDGTDYSYFIQVTIGSQGAKYYMLVDSGAGSSWLMGSDCSSDACSRHDTLGPSQSDSLKISTTDFSVAYGSGKVSGKLANDSFSLAGMKLNYEFGLASTTSEEFSNFPFDGILGLSMGTGSSANFLQTLASSGAVKSNVFAVALSRAADDATSGEIKFGGTNPAKYTGSISYNAVASKSGDWAINIDDMSYAGSKAGVGGKLAYIDTGTTYIFGPESLVDKLHSVVKGAVKQGTSYTVPCDATTPITVTFSGVDYNIPAKDWIAPKDANGKCTSNFYGQEVVKDSWLMGATFLKSVYAVFDKDGQRIGFATQAAASAGSSPSASSSTASVPSGSSSVFSSSLSSSSLGPTSNPATPSSTSISTTGSASATSTKPSLGLTGQETKTTGSSTSSVSSVADASKTQDKGNAAPGLHVHGAHLASAVGVAVLFLLI